MPNTIDTLKAKTIALQIVDGMQVSSIPSLQARVVSAYHKKTLAGLLAILEAPAAEQLTQLETFLRENWALIKGTALCYTAIPTDSVTKLMCDVARYIVETKPGLAITAAASSEDSAAHAVLGVLMPGLSLDSINGDINTEGARLYPDLSSPEIDAEEVLRTHVLDSKGYSLIPVRVWSSLDITPEPTPINNPYYDRFHPNHASMSEYLQPEEIARLVGHSRLTQAVQDAKTHYESLSNDASNLLGQLRQLCSKLSLNSASYAGGVGTEDNAGLGAYDAILAFNAYYRNLVACDLIFSDQPPSEDTLADLPGSAPVAYVCCNDAVYYVNKKTSVCHPIPHVTPAAFAKLQALAAGSACLSLTDDNECDLVRLEFASDDLPEIVLNDILNDLPGTSNAAYVCLSDGMYYVDKRTGSSEKLNVTPVDASHIQSMLGDQGFSPLTRAQLDDITSRTTHVHNKLIRVATLTAYYHDDGIPAPVKASIETLLELSTNPGANTNATANLQTCIAIRRTELAALMRLHEMPLSQIGALQGAHKAHLLAEARRDFEDKKKALVEALDKHEYADGHDSLYLTQALLTVLKVRFSIRSKEDIELLKTLAPSEITMVFSKQSVLNNFLRQLGEPLVEPLVENFISFALEISPPRLQALWSALTRTGSMDQLAPSDIAELLMLLDVDRSQIIWETAKDRWLHHSIRSAVGLAIVIKNLTPEQCGVVFNDYVSSAFIRNINDLCSLMVLCEDNDGVRDIIFEKVKDRLPVLIRGSLDGLKVLSMLSKEQRAFALESVQADLPRLIKDRPQLLDLLRFSSEESRALVLNRMAEQLPKLFRKANLDDLFGLFSAIPMTDTNMIAMVQKYILKRIDNPVTLGLYLSVLAPEKCFSFIQFIQKEQPNYLKKFINFVLVSNDLDDSRFSSMLNAMGDHIPVKTVEDLSEFLQVTKYKFISFHPIIIAKVQEKPPGLIQSVEDVLRLLNSISGAQGGAYFFYQALRSSLEALVVQIEGGLTPDEKRHLTEMIDTVNSPETFEDVHRYVRTIVQMQLVNGQRIIDSDEDLTAMLSGDRPQATLFEAQRGLSSLASELLRYRVNVQDKELTNYVESAQLRIREATTPEACQALKQELKNTLASVSSPQVQAVKDAIQGYRRGLTLFNRKSAKADNIADALCAMPPQERGTVLSAARNAVQDEIGRQRLRGKVVQTETLKRLKAQFTPDTPAPDEPEHTKGY